MNHKTALIIGSTGLVGQQCLKLLLSGSEYDAVIALTRNALPLKHEKLKNLVVDFNQLDKYKSEMVADDIFCSIGTTIGKAGSQAAFKKVDFDIPLRVATIARANGAKTFILVSSLGADAKSPVFYSRTKGELEESLTTLNYPALIILQPSILLGNRADKRTGEEVGRFVAGKLGFLFAGPLKKYKGMPVDLLAKAMIKAANTQGIGKRIIENDEIFDLVEK